MRGAIELPAVAIFTIVAGSLIVLFFVLLTQQNAEGAKNETEARSLNFLDTLIKTAVTARETQNNITVVDEAIVFTCDETGMRFGFESDNALDLFDLVVFSPRRLEGGLINAYSKGADVPYRAFNVLYLTGDGYEMQTTTDLGEFPATVHTKTVTPAGGDKKIRLVAAKDEYQASPNSFRGYRDIVLIEPFASDGSYGRVWYVTATGSDSVVYPTRELLYGALLSRDKQTYDCTFNVFLKQLKFANSIQRERTSQLKDEADQSGSTCYPLYGLEAFDQIKALPSADTFTTDDAKILQDSIKEIAFRNERLVAGDNCVSIY